MTKTYERVDELHNGGRRVTRYLFNKRPCIEEVANEAEIVEFAADGTRGLAIHRRLVPHRVAEEGDVGFRSIDVDDLTSMVAMVGDATIAPRARRTCLQLIDMIIEEDGAHVLSREDLAALGEARATLAGGPNVE